MVSPNEGSLNLRKTPSLQRIILHSHRMEIISRADGFTGQRPNPNAHAYQRDYRSWSVSCASPKVDIGHLIYPISGRDSAESGLGCMGNPHLSCLAESNFVNVGDSQPDAKASSPPMTTVSVGAAIVVRGWESQPPGEGPQSVGIPAQNSRMRTKRNLL